MSLPEALQRDVLAQYPELSELKPEHVNLILGYAYRRGKNDGAALMLGDNPTLGEVIKAYDIQKTIRISRNIERRIMSIKYNLLSDSFDAYNKAPEALSWNLPYMKDFRGLVVNMDTFEILARPYSKFFNLNENALATWPKSYEKVEVLEKLDGSLVIYSNPSSHGEIFASSGSTNGEHATRFKEWFDNNLEKYQRKILREYGQTWTLNFEYTSPENRIVVAYDEEQMTLHGARDTKTGEDVSFEFLTKMAQEIGVPLVKKYPLKTQSDINKWLLDNREADLEGLVLMFTYADGSVNRLKVKTEQYREIHFELSKMGALFRDIDHTILTNTARLKIVQAFNEGDLDDFVAGITIGHDAILAYIERMQSTLEAYHDYKDHMGDRASADMRVIYANTDLDQEEILMRSMWANNREDAEFLEEWSKISGEKTISEE